MNTYFNSQPHEEADKALNAGSASVTAISTHSLTKRLTIFHLVSTLSVRHFNSQPHEEADWIVLRRLWSMDYFNSQPHEEADGCSYLLGEYSTKISTHSLTKRLTSCTSGSLALSHISTHSLTKRLTEKQLYEELFSVFQLTASRRG